VDLESVGPSALDHGAALKGQDIRGIFMRLVFVAAFAAIVLVLFYARG
jgi:hypothetical protein